jgi:predicted O-linked N-acetylglucosamine transferase (SPINDLY family)
MALEVRGRYGEAGQQFKQAIILKPDFVEAFVRWGRALHEMGQLKAARACWEKIIELEPERAEAYAGLGTELKAEGEHARALARFQQALSLDASNAQACIGLGNALITRGSAVEGLAWLEKAVAINPESFLHQSNLLFNLHYLAGLAAEDVAARHHAFGTGFEAPLKPCRQPHANVPDPERTLRVGFVSGDFRNHPVGFFMADLLAGLTGTGLELNAYANQYLNDDLTDRIKPMFKGWCVCKGLNDDELAARIRADGIDVLVDLSGHTDGNRLLTFARKPAPVQVSYLGYPDTTGLSAIDYLLGDTPMFPESEEALYAEKPWRLPDTALCFTPPDLPVEVGPLPAMRNGFVTFGCLNKSEKVSDAAVETWARILHAVPGSRLLLQNKPYDDADIASHMRSRFAERGIEADRVALIGKLTWQAHMETYNRVDIALDPFPYNGTTTSVEGLWMGVPLLALKGDRLVAHMGESILHAVDMPEWIAADAGDYVARAVAFASDLSALADVRAGLRQRLLASPICDAPRFARNLEEAFRGMWRKWCSQA